MLMVAFVATIGLNPLFMFGLPILWSGMGFNGIAVATIVIQTSVMVYIMLRILQLAVMQSVQPAASRPIKDSFHKS